MVLAISGASRPGQGRGVTDCLIGSLSLRHAPGLLVGGPYVDTVVYGPDRLQPVDLIFHGVPSPGLSPFPQVTSLEEDFNSTRWRRAIFQPTKSFITKEFVKEGEVGTPSFLPFLGVRGNYSEGISVSGAESDVLRDFGSWPTCTPCVFTSIVASYTGELPLSTGKTYTIKIWDGKVTAGGVYRMELFSESFL